MKPDLNDLGIIGQLMPEIDAAKCRGCKKCQLVTACPMKACAVVGGVLTIDPAVCNNCGRCALKCPFGAAGSGVPGYKVTIGGRWGKKVAQGRALSKVFTGEEELLDVVEKAILLFREQGQAGERFADTIERIGFENVEKQLLGDELLARKQEILSDK